MASTPTGGQSFGGLKQQMTKILKQPEEGFNKTMLLNFYNNSQQRQ